MEARLLAELQHKLGLLDRKLRDHRLALLAEFDDHYRQQLREADPSIVSAVTSSLRSSSSNYPDLRPEIPALDGSHLSRELPTSTPSAAAFQPSSPASVTASELRTPTTARDHETDFQGLFTPSYLPLLDSRPPIPASPRTFSHPASPTTAPLQPLQPVGGAEGTNNHPQQLQPGLGSSGSDKAASMAVQDENDEGPLARDSSVSKRPSHARSSTDDTTSSVMSDRSDKTRRSALRRSSSSSKTPQSPRRVRFDFMGTEVLPTASPQGSETIAQRPISSGHPGSKSESVLSDDDDEYEPPPRKISSSDALRALSRKPLEGTVWTVVNPDSDDASSDHTNSRPVTPNSPARSQGLGSDAPRSPTILIPEPSPRTQRLGSVDEEQEEDDNDDVGGDDEDENSSSDDEFLAMAKPKSFRNKTAIHSSGPPSPLKANADESMQPENPPNKVARSAQQKTSDRKVEDRIEEEEDPFHFEMGGLSAPPRPRARPRPITTRDDDELDDDAAIPSRVDLSAYSTSPAVSIARSRMPSGPTTPTSTKFQVGSVGSYKGRPIVMPVVRNPELHAQAESLGDFNTFVGGLDGGSGMDEGDMNSFRASVMPSGFSGTPRSLTERFMMEEAHAERKRRGEAS
ncbi:hypothetical protein NLU13_2994 [Sarocladium strictum]|uniref:Uncharacterized protein n=1 Tax=Sarocladium strictum TaxID=5046 RepID=A0AA39LA11_SARSR|nr:hypothetical protein NLU13_2994 [Sarocladium strictum]